MRFGKEVQKMLLEVLDGSSMNIYAKKMGFKKFLKYLGLLLLAWLERIGLKMKHWREALRDYLKEKGVQFPKVSPSFDYIGHCSFNARAKKGVSFSSISFITSYASLILSS